MSTQITSDEGWTSETVTTPMSVATLSPIEFVPVAEQTILTESYAAGGRWYHDSNGNSYPSITTVLRATDHEGRRALSEWRNNVGAEAAQNITSRAATLGTVWHKFCEDYVQGHPTWTAFETPGSAAYGRLVASVLHSKIRRVLASETRIVSTALGVAGRIDMCVELRDGRIVVLDFKTGKKVKSGNRLLSAALQTSFYATAMSELLGVPVTDVAVAQLIYPSAVVWQESRAELWRPELIRRIEEFAESHVST